LQTGKVEIQVHVLHDIRSLDQTGHQGGQEATGFNTQANEYDPEEDVDRPEEKISALINGNLPINAEMAFRLSLVLGVPASF